MGVCQQGHLRVKDGTFQNEPGPDVSASKRALRKVTSLPSLSIVMQILPEVRLSGNTGPACGRNHVQVPREPCDSEVVGVKQADMLIGMGGRVQVLLQKRLDFFPMGRLKPSESQQVGRVVLLTTPASPPNPLWP